MVVRGVGVEMCGWILGSQRGDAEGAEKMWERRQDAAVEILCRGPLKDDEAFLLVRGGSIKEGFFPRKARKGAAVLTSRTPFGMERKPRRTPTESESKDRRFGMTGFFMVS